MKRCGNNCLVCPYIREGNNITIKGIKGKINKQMNCNTFNIVYAIQCKKDRCREVYIGETKQTLRFCLDDHRGYVNNGVDTSTGSHFTGSGHSLSDMSVTALERVRKNSNPYRKEREKYFIRKFNTVHKGMNRKI